MSGLNWSAPVLVLFVLTVTTVAAKSLVCKPESCNHQGNCSVVNGRAKCSCNSHFTGIRCEKDVDECKNISPPCLNGATCVNYLGGFSCSCTHGWSGSDCSININECEPDGFSNCHNGGTCVDGLGYYTCVCPQNKTGPRCEHDKCVTNPCANSATCILDESGNASCICSKGWTGKLCNFEKNKSVCDSVYASNPPCYNGGTCKEVNENIACDCVPGFSGKYCEKRAPCQSSPCRNNGTCTANVGEFNCTCIKGFSGERCERNIDDCASSPCEHNGTCVDGINAYICHCIGGYTGKNCKAEIDECASNPCANGGTCRDRVNGFQCDCRKGFRGKQCEIVNQDEPHVCSVPAAGIKLCKAKYNNKTFGWNNGSCSLGTKPWDKCTTKTAKGFFCYQVFQDGQCDKECDTDLCLRDGFDCEKERPHCRLSSNCSSVFNDGHCDEHCNKGTCFKDGLDCTGKKGDAVEGTLVITVPRTFWNISQQFMFKLSHLVKMVATIETNGNNERMVSPTHKKRAHSNVSQLTEVHVKFYKQGYTGKYLKDVNMIKDFLGALKVYRKLDLPCHVFSVESRMPIKIRPPSTLSLITYWDKEWFILLLMFAAVILIGALILCICGRLLYKRMYTKVMSRVGLAQNRKDESMLLQDDGAEDAADALDRCSNNNSCEADDQGSSVDSATSVTLDAERGNAYYKRNSTSRRCERHQTHEAERLLDGADANAKDSSGRTPAVASQSSPHAEAASSQASNIPGVVGSKTTASPQQGARPKTTRVNGNRNGKFVPVKHAGTNENIRMPLLEPSPHRDSGNETQTYVHPSGDARLTTEQPFVQTDQMHILFLAKTWDESIISHMSVQFAKSGKVRVSCLVAHTNEDEKAKAKRAGVHLYLANSLIGCSTDDPIFLPPDGLIDVGVDVIIGFGHFGGLHAQIVRLRFRNSIWVHIAGSSSEDQTNCEIQFCEDSDLTFAIGRKMAAECEGRLASNKKTVHYIVPATFKEFQKYEQSDDERDVSKVITFYPSVRELIAGGDTTRIPAKAVGGLSRDKYRLIAVRSPQDEANELETFLRSDISPGQLSVRGHCSTEESCKLFVEGDLLLLPFSPSKTEQFGFVGLQALSAGLPILVSKDLGLAEALRKVPFGRSSIVTSNKPEDWSNHIQVVNDQQRSLRLSEYDILRQSYDEQYSWEGQCSKVLEEIFKLVHEIKQDIVKDEIQDSA